MPSRGAGVGSSPEGVPEVLVDGPAVVATVVVATHDRASLARADHAVLLDRGRVVVEGAPAVVAAAQARRAAEALALG